MAEERRNRRRHLARRVFRGALVLVAALTLLFVAAGAYLFASFHLAPQAPPVPNGPNALWAAHRWVSQDASDADYRVLSDLLLTNRISDVFFHVGPLDEGGRIPPDRFPGAPRLLDSLHRSAPSVRLQAWIGQVEARGGGPLDLADPGTRSTVVQTAASFLALGFDGIHYDIEPIHSDDHAFLDLLTRTSQVTRPEDRVLSVAAPNLDPLHLLGGVIRAAVGGYVTWSTAYFRTVAARVDQIAVMSYGNAFPASWAFGSFVRWETGKLLETVDDEVTLFIGVPSYDVTGWGLFPNAESLAGGVRGVREGMTGARPEDVGRLGVAVYADWTTSPEEWSQFRSGWLGRRTGS